MEKKRQLASVLSLSRSMNWLPSFFYTIANFLSTTSSISSSSYHLNLLPSSDLLVSRFHPFSPVFSPKTLDPFLYTLYFPLSYTSLRLLSLPYLRLYLSQSPLDSSYLRPWCQSQKDQSFFTRSRVSSVCPVCPVCPPACRVNPPSWTWIQRHSRLLGNHCEPLYLENCLS